MPASAHGSAEASSSGLAAVGAASGAPDGDLPVVGQRWRNKFEILEQLASDRRQRVWRGRAIDGGDDVILRSFETTESEHRAHEWSKLGGIDSPHLQRARESFAVAGGRIEVASAVRGVALSAWRRERTSVDADTIKAIVAQIAEALGALHAFEMVHLGLRPEVVFIEEKGASTHCTVGGLETITAFDHRDMVRAAVDPFYAPPEAVGLQMHVAGPGLCSWDWWSLGRIAQELVLGQSVVRTLHPEAKDDAELREHAESLVAEVDPKGPRAGAVERMPSHDPNLQLLLRGLLTSASESRWTGDNVDRWVRGQPVKEFYSAPRQVTRLKWRGRPYTVPELAAALQSAENWSEASVQVFDSDTPGTLANFLKWAPSQTTVLAQLTSALELADSLPLKLSSPTVQRETITMVALMQLSSGKLLWRGQELGAATVAAMMRDLGETDAVTILRALTVRATALQIERIDAGAGRLLTELGRTAGDAEGVLKRYSWLAANDAAGAARLFRLSLESPAALRATRDELTKRYAGSDHPAMAKLFKAQNLGRAEFVILGWAAAAPEGFKFFTHEEADRRRAEALRTRGSELVTTLAWPQFARALQAGRIVFGDWGWFLLTWLVVGAVFALLWAGPLGLVVAAAPVVAAWLVRVIFASRHRRLLRTVHPQATWSWHDGPARCARELRVAGAGVRQQVLEEELANVQKELATLSHVTPAAAPLQLPDFKAVRASGMFAWGLLGACLLVAGWREYQRPFGASSFKQAWAPQSAPKPAPKPAAVAATPDEKDADIKVSWPFKSVGEATDVTVQSTVAATSAQIEYATKHGRELVKPYRPETISSAIILPVPSANPDQAAVMFFDGKRGELSNQQVYVLAYHPIPRTFISVDERKGVYLDQ